MILVKKSVTYTFFFGGSVLKMTLSINIVESGNDSWGLGLLRRGFEHLYTKPSAYKMNNYGFHYFVVKIHVFMNRKKLT